MALRVLVVGGYGNFGSIVCRHLIDMPGVELAISGRDPQKLERKVAELGASCERWCGDAMGAGFTAALRAMNIQLVIHTGGRFRGNPMQWPKAASRRASIIAIWRTAGRSSMASAHSMHGRGRPVSPSSVVAVRCRRCRRRSSMSSAITSNASTRSNTAFPRQRKCRGCRRSRVYWRMRANRSASAQWSSA